MSRLSCCVVACLLHTQASADVFDRLQDSGRLAGVGWAFHHTADRTRCGGTRVTLARGTKLGQEDRVLAKMFALDLPRGLSFDPKRPHAARVSMNRFTKAISDLTAVSAATIKHYEAVAAAGDDSAKARAGARIVQIHLRMASVIARTEIPKDVRAEPFAADKTEAFCARLSEVVEPILDRADQVRTACAARVPAASQDWWASVCRTP